MLQAEVGLKVMSTCVSLVKEANLKVVLASLECVGQLVVDRREAFSSLLGVALDALIPRLGDTKVSRACLSARLYAQFCWRSTIV